MTKTIQTFPVNERDEIVAQQGIGTANIVGYLQVDSIPVDEVSGKVVIKLDASTSTTL